MNPAQHFERIDSAEALVGAPGLQADHTPCAKCGLLPLYFRDTRWDSVVRVDACFGDLLNKVVNACCGHGDPGRAYVRLSRMHSNGWDGCVDICGGEVVGYGEWTDRHRATLDGTPSKVTT